MSARPRLTRPRALARRPLPRPTFLTSRAARRTPPAALLPSPLPLYPDAMPLPLRYAQAVPEMRDTWEPAGYFQAQLSIWRAQVEALHELDGDPSAEEMDQIRDALRLSPDEIAELSLPTGHETNRLLRTVQARLPPRLGNFIHRGNTSSDVLDTALALQIIRSLDVLAEDFRRLAGRLQSLSL